MEEKYDRTDLTSRYGRQCFYNTPAWTSLRTYIIQLEPFCRRCKAHGYLVPAEVVDHIEDIAVAPSLRLEITNLQPLCKACHNRKTGKTQGNEKMLKGKEKQKFQMKTLWKI